MKQAIAIKIVCCDDFFFISDLKYSLDVNHMFEASI